MSELRVDRIVNSAGTGPVELTYGLTGAGVSGGVTLKQAGSTISGGTASTLDFTSGATISNVSSGIATITISGGGAASTSDVRSSTLVVSGVSTFSSNVNISGNLTVDGTTTTVNSTTITVDDKNIELGSVASPSNTTADGGGITLKGATDKTLNWVNSTASWTSSENLDLASGKTFKINATDVLTSTQVLGKTVPSGTIVGTTDAQTLTNKTLTSPVISSISNTGTVTLPTSTTTLVGRDTTDTLTNKTLSSATLTGTLTAGGGTGTNGQALISTGAGVCWGTVSGGGGSSVFAACNTSNFLSCNTCAPNISTGANNFLVGCNAGICLSSSNNIAIGCCALRGGTGEHNIMLGKFAGNNTTSGTDNIFLGRYAGLCYVGSGAGQPYRNIFIGAESGCNITGGCNVVIGSFTGTGYAACTNHIFLSDGTGNNRLHINNCGAFGLNGANYGTAGQVLTSCGSGGAPAWTTVSGGGSSAIAGCCTSNFLSCNTCAPNISTGANNFLVGCNAGICLSSSSSNNIAIGCCALRGGTGEHNIMLGKFAGNNTTSGNDNIFLGRYAGLCYVGSGAGQPYNNIFIGCESGCNITGGCNVVIGSFTGTKFESCSNHIFLSDGTGNNRMQFNNYGSLGFAGACYGNPGQVLTSCGNYASPQWTTISGGGGSSAIAGCCTSNFLSCNTCAPNISWQAANNFFVGCAAGRCLVTGCNNTIIGAYAGASLSTGSNNFFAGSCAGRCNNSGTGNFFAGRCAGYYNTYGGCNIHIGDSAGRLSTGSQNIFLGKDSGGGASGCGSYNVFMGQYSGRYNTSGSYNFFAGYGSGPNSICACIGGHYGSCNTFIGKFSGYYNQSGCHNFFAGACTGYCNSAGSANIFIGRDSGWANTTGGCNTFLGHKTGCNTSTGSNNFFAGHCAGVCNSTGCNNIAIGFNSGGDALYTLPGACGPNDIIVMGNCSHTRAYVQVQWTTGSDARDKTNIIPIPVGKEFLKQLNPVQYQWADRETGEVRLEKPNYGFLAQDILALENPPQVIVDDHDPDHLKLREGMIVPILVKSVQELIEEVEALKEEIRILKGE